MVAAPSSSIIPAHVVTHARGGASFTRDFSRDRGSVEIAPGVQQPRVSVSASVVTSKTGTDTQFWALRTSITVFHAPSGRFVTAHDAVHDLPFGERDLARLHDDTTWIDPIGLQAASLTTRFKHNIAYASKRADNLAFIWKADLIDLAQAEVALRRELACISNDFKAAITQSLG